MDFQGRTRLRACLASSRAPGSDGLVAFKKLKGREPSEPIAAFGERVLFHIPKPAMTKRKELDPRWVHGTFVIVVACCTRNVCWDFMICSDDSFVDEFDVLFCQTIISQ